MALNRDLGSLRRIQQQRVQAGAASESVDDATWSDLDLDELLADLDGCQSVLGQMSLFGWLRSPARTKAEVEARRRAVEVEPDISPKWLERLRRFPPLLAQTLWGAKALPTLGATPMVLAIVALCSHLLFMVSTQVGTFATVTAFAINLAYHFWSLPKIDAAIASLELVAALLLATQQISVAVTRAKSKSTRAQRVVELMRQLRPLQRAVTTVTVPRVFDDVPAEHLRVMYLSRERRLSSCAKLIEQHRTSLIELIDVLGEIDAASSVAAFRARRSTCTPELDAEAHALELGEARHPALGQMAVANSVTLRAGLVITGSNMSGKSTFLRTVALNVLCAQALGFACAARYRGPLMRVATSLRSSDRLSAGESTYFAEAKRMLELLELAAHPTRLLLLVDEPFRGTNSAERIAAATAVLRHASSRGAWVLAATHDLEVSRLLAPAFDQAHFVDAVTAEGLSFDYRLRGGLAGARNAVMLLACLGYPQAVIDEAKSLLSS